MRIPSYLDYILLVVSGCLLLHPRGHHRQSHLKVTKAFSRSGMREACVV